MYTDKVFSSYKLKNFTIRNRLGVAPMTRCSASPDSMPRRDVFDFLIRRAEHGAGIVFTEGVVTDFESSQGYPGQSRILTQRLIDAWGEVAVKIKQRGALALMQFFHCGRVSWPGVNPAHRIIAPSAIAHGASNVYTQSPYPVPDAMSKYDIDHVIEGFVESVKGAMQAGYDGIELHGAHGYLINEFLSSHANTRGDDYGGTLENRFRFARELIRASRAVMPADRLLTFRLSNFGTAHLPIFQYPNLDEWQQLIKLFATEPIDVISLSCYNFQEEVYGTDKNLAQVTREVTTLPLMVCGKIHDYATAEAALQHADIALSAKSMLLNPDWVEEVRARKALPLRSSQDAGGAYGKDPIL